MRRILLATLLVLGCGDSTGPAALSVTGTWHCQDNVHSDGQLWSADLVDQNRTVTGTFVLRLDDDTWTCDVFGERLQFPQGEWLDAHLICTSEVETGGFDMAWEADVRRDALTGTVGLWYATMARAEGDPPACD